MIKHRLLIHYLDIIKVLAAKVPLQRLIIVLSLIIGVLSGLSAVLLKNMVFSFSEFLKNSLDIHSVNIIYFAFPLLGLSLTYIFVRLILKEKKLQGITRILHAISTKESKLKKADIISPVIGATLTVGAGGSVGLESPIVLSGSAIGSNLGLFFNLNYKTTTLLVGCGAAGATAGIFSAPVTAVLFALEILMIDLTTWSIIPLLISAVTGTAISWLFLRNGAVFDFTVMDPLVIADLHYYALLGILAGFISVYFTRGTKKIEYWMKLSSTIDWYYDSKKKKFAVRRTINKKWASVRRLLIGGFVLGTLIFLFPPLYGEGYDALNMILTDRSHELANSSLFYNSSHESMGYLILFLTLVMIVKVIAMAVTTGSGGIGGIFAPSLFMGGLSGYILAFLFNLFPFCNVSSKNFVMAGMAGVLSGVLHAPLTAIFLIIETTGGYGLFLAISLSSAFAFVISKYLEPNTIYTDRLAKRGELITHNKDQAVLVLLQTNELIEKDFTVLRLDQTLRDLVSCFPDSKRNIYPVVDKDGIFKGIINLDDVRHLVFRSEFYDTVKIKDLVQPCETIQTNTHMEKAMDMFEITGKWNLPVTNDGKYIGFLSRSRIFSAYRNKLKGFYE